MLLQRTDKLPESPSFAYELKLDGFRAEAIKNGGQVHLRSCNDKDFTGKYPAIVQALAAMPDEQGGGSFSVRIAGRSRRTMPT